MESSLLGQSFVGFHRTTDRGSSFRAVNPATRQELEPQFFSTTEEDLDAAVSLAEEAFRSYGSLPGAARAAFLRAIASEMEVDGDELIARAHLESGLPLARLQGELARTCGQLRMFASVVEEGSWASARIDRADPSRKPLPKPNVRSVLRPLGPVAIFGASNFPLAFSVAGGDTASAFFAGCPVILKALPSYPTRRSPTSTSIRSPPRACPAG